MKSKFIMIFKFCLIFHPFSGLKPHLYKWWLKVDTQISNIKYRIDHIQRFCSCLVDGVSNSWSLSTFFKRRLLRWMFWSYIYCPWHKVNIKPLVMFESLSYVLRQFVQLWKHPSRPYSFGEMSLKTCISRHHTRH